MKKILVIEDEQFLREGIVGILHSLSFEVVAAANGVSGVEQAREHLPDLILCDVVMPELDGYGTLARLRQDPTTALITFIFLTAKAEKLDMRTGMELGADDYLTKPFTIPELLAAIRTRLEKQTAIDRKGERKMEELRGNIIHALPHELLTPLTSILGFSKLLVEEGGTMKGEEIGRMAHDIERSAKRLHSLIGNYLLYAQIELLAGDPQKLEMLRANRTNHTSQLIAQVLKDKALESNRESDLHMELVEATLQISKDNLRKVVEEVADNAFKFSLPGTPVHVVSTVDEKSFTLEVSDRGRGMGSEEVANVGAYMQFQRKFFEQQGSGMGLIILKRLTELHGGQFSINSTINENTTVRVTFNRAS